MIEIAQDLKGKFGVLLGFACALYPFGQLDQAELKEIRDASSLQDKTEGLSCFWKKWHRSLYWSHT